MTKYWRPRVCSDDVTTTGFPHVAMISLNRSRSFTLSMPCGTTQGTRTHKDRTTDTTATTVITRKAQMGAQKESTGQRGRRKHERPCPARLSTRKKRYTRTNAQPHTWLISSTMRKGQGVSSCMASM